MGYKIKGSHLKLTSLLLLLFLTGCEVDYREIKEDRQYIVVRTREVNDYINEGYYPLGGPTCAHNGCFQGMMKEPDIKDDEQWQNPLSTNEANP